MTDIQLVLFPSTNSPLLNSKDTATEKYKDGWHLKLLKSYRNRSSGKNKIRGFVIFIIFTVNCCKNSFHTNEGEAIIHGFKGNSRDSGFN